MAIKQNDPTLEAGNVASTDPTAGVDPVDRAIPGQSLTDEPGKWNWETPATIDAPQEAIDYAINRLTNDEQTYKRTIELLAGEVEPEKMPEKVQAFMDLKNERGVE
jgi:hypothetical protein